MPKLQWEPKINAGHVLLAGSLALSGIGLYYNTQAKIAAEETSRRLADAAFERDISALQDGRQRDRELLEAVNGKADANHLELETHKARTEGATR